MKHTRYFSTPGNGNKGLLLNDQGKELSNAFKPFFAILHQYFYQGLSRGGICKQEYSMREKETLQTLFAFLDKK